MIPTPGQGIIFVKIGSMTGSMSFFTPKGRFRSFALLNVIQITEGNISIFSDRFCINFLAGRQCTILFEENKRVLFKKILLRDWVFSGI